jgi:hypothetical protein
MTALLFGFLIHGLHAQDLRAWQGLNEGMLLEAYDQDTEQAIDWYRGLVTALPDDDPTHDELNYWLGRAYFEVNDPEAAIETLRTLSSPRAQALTQRIEAHLDRITDLPIHNSFLDGLGSWRHSWQHGQSGSVSLGAPEDGDPALEWSTIVSDQQEDSIRIVFNPDTATPSIFRFSMRSTSFPGYILPTVHDSTGYRFSVLEPILVPKGEWTAIEIYVDDMRPSEGGPRRPVGGISGFELRDVTAFHGTDRGDNTLYLGDVVIH